MEPTEPRELGGSVTTSKGRPCSAKSSGGTRKRIWLRENRAPQGITVGVMPFAAGSLLMDWLKSTMLASQLLRSK
jgi:hypothetical protein